MISIRGVIGHIAAARGKNVVDWPIGEEAGDVAAPLKLPQSACEGGNSLGRVGGATSVH